MTNQDSSSLSEQLLRAREARGETIEQVNQQVGISPKVLRGLESGQLDVVEPVYVLLSLKSYAEHLELDVDKMLHQFEAELGKAPKPTPISVAANAAEGAPLVTGGAAWFADGLEMFRRLPQTQRLTVIIAFVFVGILAVLWLTDNIDFLQEQQSSAQPGEASVAQHLSKSDGNASGAPRASEARQPATPPPAEPLDDDSSELAAEVSPRAETIAQEPEAPAPTAESTVASESTVQAVSAEPSQNTEQGESSPVETENRLEDASRAIVNDDAADSAAPASTPAAAVSEESDEAEVAAPPEAPPATNPQGLSDLLTLEAEAVESTWVQIQWDDGAGGTEVVIRQGEKRRWQARHFFMVKAGRAHGVRFFLQGKLLGNGRLGDPTEVLRFRASRDSVILLSRDLQPLSQLSVEHDVSPSE